MDLGITGKRAVVAGSSAGLGLAAAYWALPISWLSSGVLGFFDGAPAAATLAALIAAQGGVMVRF